MQADYQEIYNGHGNNFLRLLNRPIQTVTSVTINLNTAGASPSVLDGSYFIHDNDRLQFSPTKSNPAGSQFLCGFQNYMVNYRAGYPQSLVPPAIKRAAALMIRTFITSTNPGLIADAKTVGKVTLRYGKNWLDLNDSMYASAKRLLSSYVSIRYVW